MCTNVSDSNTEMHHYGMQTTKKSIVSENKRICIGFVKISPYDEFFIAMVIKLWSDFFFF